MARILSHPFRIAPNGSIATVEQDSVAGDAEQIAVAILTRIGERPLAPVFGVTDPTFGHLVEAELAACVQLHGPPVEIRGVTTTVTSDTTQTVEVDFA